MHHGTFSVAQLGKVIMRSVESSSIVEHGDDVRERG